MPVLTLKAQIHAGLKTQAVLKDAMRSATKVYNGLMWQIRKEQQEAGKLRISRKNLNRVLAQLPRAREYYSMSAQLTRDEVIQAWRSFFALRKRGLPATRRRERISQHQAPGFRRKNYLSPLKYVQSGFSVAGDQVTLSQGTSRGDGVRIGARASASHVVDRPPLQSPSTQARICLAASRARLGL